MNAQFLPVDYEPPKSSGGYMKLQDGENKIRILSKPILGWEEWIDQKPVRYKYDEKPDAWVDHTKPGRHFWSFLVWNYSEERVQILHILQGSIRKGIEDLTKDSDWGNPAFYDIKIHRSGKDLKTKYSVIAANKSEVPEYMKDAYRENPCNLSNLFTGDDPFGDYSNPATPLWEIKVESGKTISIEQMEEIERLIDGDADYMEKLNTWLQNQKIDKLAMLPVEQYKGVIDSINAHNEKKKQNQSLPF